MNKTISVYLGGECRKTVLYKKKNGCGVFWSPFTGERVVVPNFRRATRKAAKRAENERKVAASRKCPEREPLPQTPNSPGWSQVRPPPIQTPVASPGERLW